MSKQEDLELARSAAKDFCVHFDFPADKIKEIEGPPLSNPGTLEREGRHVVSFRWLGGGRGDYYVQVEIYQDNRQITVYGGYEDKEFGPWSWKDKP